MEMLINALMSSGVLHTDSPVTAVDTLGELHELRSQTSVIVGKSGNFSSVAVVLYLPDRRSKD